MATGSGKSTPKGTGDESDLVSIGDLAEASGIAPDTIRAWERRYGRPKAVRLPSGHRRYTAEDVRWLRRMAEALSLGRRPSSVVKLTEAELDELLVKGKAVEEAESPALRKLLDLVANQETTKLHTALRKDAKRLRPKRFLRERVAPLLLAIGRAWCDGRIGVRHEHLASEVVEDVMRRVRTDTSMPRTGPRMVLTTLPNETHGLGVQMVALECLVAGVRPHVLGVNSPMDEIVQVAKEIDAAAVGVSISLATGGVKTDRLLAELRKRLPSDVRLLVGGGGARGVRRGPQGVEYARGWDELEQWLQDLAAR